jgi:hypothetical protein
MTTLFGGRICIIWTRSLIVSMAIAFSAGAFLGYAAPATVHEITLKQESSKSLAVANEKVISGLKYLLGGGR